PPSVAHGRTPERPLLFEECRCSAGAGSVKEGWRGALAANAARGEGLDLREREGTVVDAEIVDGSGENRELFVAAELEGGGGGGAAVVGRAARERAVDIEGESHTVFAHQRDVRPRVHRDRAADGPAEAGAVVVADLQGEMAEDRFEADEVVGGGGAI